MSALFRAAALAACFFAAGCAIYPLPEDVTGVESRTPSFGKFAARRGKQLLAWGWTGSRTLITTIASIQLPARLDWNSRMD